MPPRSKGASIQIKTVSGLNGTIPTSWDSGWQLYTDLTREQITAFQAMPEWGVFVSSFNTWLQAPNVAVAPSLTVQTVAALQGVSTSTSTGISVSTSTAIVVGL